MERGRWQRWQQFKFNDYDATSSSSTEGKEKAEIEILTTECDKQ